MLDSEGDGEHAQLPVADRRTATICNLIRQKRTLYTVSKQEES